MAKNKSSDTPHYELLYIVSNKYSEDELIKVINKVRDIINNSGGKITFSEEWGKKRLAYPINHFRHGYYNLVEFDLLGENLAKVDKALRMFSEILRHQIVRKEERAVEVIKKDKRAAAQVIKKKEPDQVKEKVNLKDLDKKLDKILETEDLL